MLVVSLAELMGTSMVSEAVDLTGNGMADDWEMRSVAYSVSEAVAAWEHERVELMAVSTVGYLDFEMAASMDKLRADGKVVL